MSTKLKSLIQQIIKEEVALFEKKKKKDELPPLDVDVDIEAPAEEAPVDDIPADPAIDMDMSGDIGGGSVETTGYLGAAISNGTVSAFTTGIGLGGSNSAASVRSGLVQVVTLGSNLWVAGGSFAQTDSAVAGSMAANKTTAATLDRVRITTVNGTDTFDAGTINILYEG